LLLKVYVEQSPWTGYTGSSTMHTTTTTTTTQQIEARTERYWGNYCNTVCYDGTAMCYGKMTVRWTEEWNGLRGWGC